MREGKKRTSSSLTLDAEGKKEGILEGRGEAIYYLLPCKKKQGNKRSVNPWSTISKGENER